jgi:hypothetical protein
MRRKVGVEKRNAHKMQELRGWLLGRGEEFRRMGAEAVRV